jgi:hypothetical protein
LLFFPYTKTDIALALLEWSLLSAMPYLATLLLIFWVARRPAPQALELPPT